MNCFYSNHIEFHRIDIDHLLAQHIAHLFTRDTITLFEEKLHLDDTQETDHFEVGLL